MSIFVSALVELNKIHSGQMIKAQQLELS